MALDVQLLLQARLYAILTADATLMGLITGVFDHVPDGQTYPYVTIGDDQLHDWGSHTHDGFEGTVTIHVWSQKAGKKQAMTIMSRLYELLHDIDLGISGCKTVSCRRGLNEILKDPDGKTHHGIQQYNVILGGVSA